MRFKGRFIQEKEVNLKDWRGLGQGYQVRSAEGTHVYYGMLNKQDSQPFPIVSLGTDIWKIKIKLKERLHRDST